jgi:hypothetical protein
MRSLKHLAFGLLAVAALAGTPALAANICQAEKMSCATTMPVDGYCECTSHGTTQGGTVVNHPVSRRPANATSGGCGTNPKDAGCH